MVIAAAMVIARVVLPTWRGPISSTAAWRPRASRTNVKARRGIILAIYPRRGNIARKTKVSCGGLVVAAEGYGLPQRLQLKMFLVLMLLEAVTLG
jgi:hypothetical protein